MFWQYTPEDITLRLRVYLGEKQAEAVQNFESLALIAGRIFGSNKNKSKGSEQLVSTKEGMKAAAKELFSNGR